MKAYVMTTGIIFVILAGLHFWRAIDERSMFHKDPLYFLAVIGIGVFAAGLSIWAWRLVRISKA